MGIYTYVIIFLIAFLMMGIEKLFSKWFKQLITPEKKITWNKKNVWIFLFFFIVILSVYIGQVNSSITGEKFSIKFLPMIFVNPFVLILTMFALYPILRHIIKISRNLSYKIDAYDDIQTLNREINVKYNPSIVSYLIDGEINQRALIADIMNLYAKKIIDIENQVIQNRKRYKLNINSEMIKSIKIFKSDAYIIDSIIYKRHKFEFSEWDKLVENTLFKRGFHKTGQKKYCEKDLPKPLCIIFLVLLFPMFLCFKKMSYAIIFSLFLTCLSVIPILFLFDFFNSKETRKFNLNKLGKEEVKNWIKFERFIKEYTLLKDKNMEDIIIYEKYIPYAVALGSNLNYNDTMYSIFNEEDVKEILYDIENKNVFGEYEKNNKNID